MHQPHRTSRARTFRWLLLAAALGALAVGLLAACSSDDNSSETSTGKIDYSKLGGEIRIDGSSTVFPISEAVAEEFGKKASTRVNVAFSGTGGGFEKFCRGEIQLSDASRPIKDSEKTACANSGITDVVEFQVAIDALTVMVHPQNTWVTCLTTKQLNTLFKVGGATKWNDINPAWPADNIKFYYPGADSGTFDYFKEVIIDGVDKNSKHRSDGTASEDDNILAQGIENDKNGIGYFGFAYFVEAGKKLKAVQIDGGKGCVTPSLDTALGGQYTPLSRPLFFYTRESFLRNRPEVLGFVNFYLENTVTLSEEVGYIPLPNDLLARQQAKLLPFLPS